MPPPMKRSHAAANLHNGKPTPSKRRRPIEATVLSSSDSEPDAFEPVHTRKLPASEDNSSQESHPRRSWNLLQQLQEDAFSDLKTDLRLELDSLRQPTTSGAADSKAAQTKLPPDEDTVQAVRDVLQQWVQQDKAARPTNHFYYRLDHTYNEDQLPPQAFRGRDVAVVDTLERISEELPVDIFFALLDRDDSDPTLSYLARSLVDQQGHELISDIPVDRKNWLQTTLSSLKARPPDAEVAVMLVPQDSLVDFVMQYDVFLAGSFGLSSLRAVEGFARYLIDRISDQDRSDRFLSLLKELCGRVWQFDLQKGLSIFPDAVVESLLRAVAHARDWEFLEQAASCLGGCPPVDFFKWAAEQVASGEIALADIQKSLLTAALTSTTPFDRILAAHRSIPLRTSDAGCELLHQLIDRVPDDLGEYGSCSQIGQLLVDLIYTTQGFDALATKLPPLVEKHAAHPAFVLGILNGLSCSTSDRPALSSLPPGLFEQLSQTFVNALDISKLFQRAPHAWQGRGCVCAGTLSSKPASSGAVDALQLADIISELLARNADSVLRRFALKIAADAGLIPPREFTSLWLPFLGHLIKVLQKHRVPLSTPRYRHLFAAVLEAYFARCAGEMPRKWIPKVQAIFCMCRICKLFNCFLRSNVQAASFISLSPSERDYAYAHLGDYTYTNCRCYFTIQDKVLTVTKMQEIDPRRGPAWQERTVKAHRELDKLDGPELRSILGERDYHRIRYVPDIEKPQPVPIESLEEARKQSPAVQAPKTPVSTRTSTSFGSTYQPLGSGLSSGSSARHLGAPAFTGGTPTPSHSTMCNAYPPTPARGEGCPEKRLSTPAVTPSTQSSADPGYRLFADELGARLSTMSSFATPESIQIAIAKRWGNSSPEVRQHYAAKAANLRHSVNSDRLPSTPKPSPHGASPPARLPRIQESPNLPARRDVPGNRSVGSRRPTLTPTPRVGAAASLWSSPSSRAFAPVSSSGLNSVRPQGQPKIKSEVVPRATSRPARREAVEVIDLTGAD